MANRPRNRPLIPGNRRGQAKQVESKPASDSVKLQWNEIMGPVYAASNAMTAMTNNLVERTVAELARKDGVDLKRFVLNVDTMEWVPRQRDAINDNSAGNPSG